MPQQNGVCVCVVPKLVDWASWARSRPSVGMALCYEGFSSGRPISWAEANLLGTYFRKAWSMLRPCASCTAFVAPAQSSLNKALEKVYSIQSGDSIILAASTSRSLIWSRYGNQFQIARSIRSGLQGQEVRNRPLIRRQGSVQLPQHGTDQCVQLDQWSGDNTEFNGGFSPWIGVS